MLPAILLIDDDTTANFLHERLLRRLAVSQQILVAQNGQQGLDLLRQHCHPGSTTCPALVLLDLNMPVLDGWQFLEALPLEPLTCAPPVVVVLTSSRLLQDQVQFQHLPVADFLNKPLTREKILDVLTRYFPGV